MTEVYFITGTDTDVGKTYCTIQLIKQDRENSKSVLALKPVATGCELDENNKLINHDAVLLLDSIINQNINNNLYNNINLDDINYYNFEPPVSPHIVNKNIMAKDIAYKCLDSIEKFSPDICYIEGAGGFLCPLNKTQSFADIAMELNTEIILIVPIKLGCLNHAMLTINNILSKNLKIHGWVANCLDKNNLYIEENIEYLKQNIPARMLARF